METGFAFRFLGSSEQQSSPRVAQGLEDHMSARNSVGYSPHTVQI